MDGSERKQGRLRRGERAAVACSAALAMLVAARPMTTSELLLLLERAGAAPPGLSRSGRLRQLQSVLAKEGEELGFAAVRGRFRTISPVAMGRPSVTQWRLDLDRFLRLDEERRGLFERLRQAAACSMPADVSCSKVETRASGWRRLRSRLSARSAG